MRDPDKKPDNPQDYLDALAEWGTISKACSTTGIPRTMVQEFRKKDDFLVAEELAMEAFKGTLIDAAIEQGRDGILEEVVYQGKRKYEVDPDTNDFMRDEKNGLPIPLKVRKYTPTLLVKAIDHFFPQNFEWDDKPVRLNLNVVRIKDGDKTDRK